MRAIRRVTGSTFRAFSSHNYRLFFAAQVISVSGTWMQQVGQSWLVLQLTGSAVALGGVLACQFLPLLLLGPIGGLVADRFDNRRVLWVTQSLAGLTALVLGVLTATGSIQLWSLYALALVTGTANAFDVPARQTFVHRMVGPELLPNAVGLNGVIMNSARVVGPALAGVLIGTIGMAPCFFVNAASFVAPITALALMRTRDFTPRADSALSDRSARQGLADGIRYVATTPALRATIITIAVIGTLTYEFQVTLPLLAKFVFGTGPEGFGLLLAAMSGGAVIGGLVSAATNRASTRRVGVAALALGVSVLATSAAPTYAIAAMILPFVGLASITLITSANATLQLTSDDAMRGRVMALYSMAFLGSTPVGGMIIGWVAQVANARVALIVGGAAAVVTVACMWRPLMAADSRCSKDSVTPGPGTEPGHGPGHAAATAGPIVADRVAPDAPAAAAPPAAA